MAIRFWDFLMFGAQRVTDPLPCYRRLPAPRDALGRCSKNFLGNYAKVLVNTSHQLCILWFFKKIKKVLTCISHALSRHPRNGAEPMITKCLPQNILTTKFFCVMHGLQNRLQFFNCWKFRPVSQVAVCLYAGKGKPFRDPSVFLSLKCPYQGSLTSPF